MTKPKWQVLIVVCVGVFMASLDLFIVNIAFPDLERDFGGTSLSSLSWVLNAYAIVVAALLVPAGRWADLLGRKRGFLLGLAVFTLASAACAVAPSVEALVAARVLQAAGAAVMLPTSLGLLLPVFPAERRHVAIGAWAAAGGVAAAAGPPLGGLLVELSWRWVFVVNVPVGIAALVVGARALTEVRDPSGTRPDVVGAGLVTAAIGTLVVAIVQGPDWGWGSARVAGLFAVSAVLVAALALRSARVASPIIEPELLRVRSFSLATVASLLFFAAFSAMLLGSVLFLTNVWHESVLDAGLMLAPGPATAAAFSIPGARLGKRFGPRAVGLAGALLFAAGGLWWMTQLGDATSYVTGFLPGMLIGGAGVGLVNPSLTGAATAELPPARFATGAGVLTMGRQVGSALGVAVLVAVLGVPAAAADFDSAWTLMIGAAVAAAGTFALLGPAKSAVAVAAGPATDVGVVVLEEQAA
jgi:EmrB/QacA subfamily drug resistance transporter